MTKRELIDHIGWDLWQASQAWKALLEQKMIARGHAVYGEARGGLIRHIGAQGVTQAVLAQKAQVSKQAVQQQLDELEAEGYVTRCPDPDDARRKIVRLTPTGEGLFEVANDVKREIEAHYAALIGADDLWRLKAALSAIIADRAEAQR